MTKIVLIHWKSEEIPERVARLEAAGYEVVPYSSQGGEGLREFRDLPPDAFVIDLSRLPSHGRAVATFLRQQKSTRMVPLVFVEGDPEKLERIRQELPDATYTDWRKIRGALSRTLKRPPEKPVVPGTMDAYSNTPLPKKLGIAKELVVVLLGPPECFLSTLGDLPDGVRLVHKSVKKADVVILFAKSEAEYVRKLPAASRLIENGGRLWIAWRKQASGMASDLTEPKVRKIGLDSGLVDFKICAIDSIWSGLCFTRRRTKTS